MIKQIDNTIDRLIFDGNVVNNIVSIEFNNIYKYDSNFRYEIDKEHRTVTVIYREKTKFGFELPVIMIPLSPPISYLLFWKRTYTHQMTDTFKLEYSLAMYYTICLQTYLKNNILFNSKQLKTK